MCAIPFGSTLMGPLCQHGKASQRWGASRAIRSAGLDQRVGTGIPGRSVNEKPTACVLTLGLDKQNEVTLFNVAREPWPGGAPVSSKVWQAPKADIARLEV